ncbi:MAG: hypothetical protein C5B51_27550 [Terriglobia bacterium]|nr:MAG: hypothetical protein C5B51_27550 [Terriglobia bacterium]
MLATIAAERESTAGFPEFLETHARWVVIGFSALYWAATWHTASTKPLWNDEIVTRYIAGIPGIRELLKTLSTGIDGQTPLFFLVTRLTGANGSPLGLRLPGMIGVWTAALCLYAFVSRRTYRACGLFAMFLPLLLGTAAYAHDARPYGLLLGGAAATLLCWQAAAENQRRRWTVLLLWAAATFTVAISYYGVFVLVPLGIGELMRWRQNGRPDLVVWSALALALAPLAIEYPVMRALKASIGVFWLKPKLLGATYGYYETMLAPAASLAAGLLVVALLRPVLFRASFAKPQPWPRAAVPELVAIAGVTALPVLYVLSGLVTGAFVPRYAIVGMTGFCAGVGFLLYHDRTLAALCVVVAGLQFAGLAGLQLRKTEVPRVLHLPPESGPDRLPVVLSGPNEFVETRYYASPELAARLYYVADPPLALQYAETDSVDLVAQKLTRIAPVQVENYTTFTSRHSRFLVVYRRYEVFGWILNKLQDDGASIALRSLGDDETVYEVSLRK